MWSGSSGAPAERNSWYSHLSGPSVKERQHRAVGVTEQGESMAVGQGFPRGVGNAASTPCSAWFISGLIREGVCNHLFINQTRSTNWRHSDKSRFSSQLLNSLLYTKYFYGSRNVNCGHLHRKTRSTRLLSEPLRCKFSVVFLEANFNYPAGSWIVLCVKKWKSKVLRETVGQVALSQPLPGSVLWICHVQCSSPCTVTWGFREENQFS